jgi:hypothetical protein
MWQYVRHYLKKLARININFNTRIRQTTMPRAPSMTHALFMLLPVMASLSSAMPVPGWTFDANNAQAADQWRGRPSPELSESVGARKVMKLADISPETFLNNKAAWEAWSSEQEGDLVARDDEMPPRPRAPPLSTAGRPSPLSTASSFNNHKVMKLKDISEDRYWLLQNAAFEPEPVLECTSGTGREWTEEEDDQVLDALEGVNESFNAKVRQLSYKLCRPPQSVTGRYFRLKVDRNVAITNIPDREIPDGESLAYSPESERGWSRKETDVAEIVRKQLGQPTYSSSRPLGVNGGIQAKRVQPKRIAPDVMMVAQTR